MNKECIWKALFHDFPEYKGNEIVTQIKNYNEDTIRMFRQIENANKKDLESKLGSGIYRYVAEKREFEAELKLLREEKDAFLA
ncbi:MAG: hypothetical protein OSJ63_04550 [Bacilli bacterium]|nr:hypothetical protein [Bacilli bacterium]